MFSLLDLFWCLQRPPNFSSNEKNDTRVLLQDKVIFYSKEVTDDSVEADLVEMHKILGTAQYRFCVNISSRCELCGCYFVRVGCNRNWRECQLTSGSRKRISSSFFQEKLQVHSINCCELFFKFFWRIMSNKLWYQLLWQFQETVERSPCSWRRFVIPRTRKFFYYLTLWKLLRAGFLSRSELLGWFETELLGFGNGIDQGPG